MSAPRFYVPQPIAGNAPLSLPENVAHHAAHVLRLRVGDGITLFNGDGGGYRAVISAIGKRAVTVAVAGRRSSPRPPLPMPNAALGLLLYRDLEFMQVLEGSHSEIEALYRAICRDPRHTTIIKLLDRDIPERESPDWAMQLVDARGALTEFRTFEFNGDAPDTGFRALQGSPGKAHRLLEHFRNALRR